MLSAKLKKINIVKKIIPCIEWAWALFAIYFTIVRSFYDLPTTWIFNVSADLICMFINLFLIMGILLSVRTIDSSYSEFLLICHANFLSLFMDYCSWMMDGIMSQKTMIFINTTLYISNIFITAAYARFIIDSIAGSNVRKKYYRIIYGFLLVSLITRLINIKMGFFFSVSKAGVYSRGPLQFVSYAYTIVVQFIVIYMLVKSNASKSRKMAVVAFTIIPFSASLVSIFVYGLSLMYACVLISIMMIYSAFFVQLEEDKDKIIENFEKYISNEIVQKIVDNPCSKLIEGRRYTATVLVSDIRGFTALSQTMNPQDLTDMLNHYYQFVTDILYQYGGIVTEFLGDGILCVFGAPKTRDDHADAAIAAALKIQQMATEINKWNIEHSYPILQTGIGINSGTMVLGSLGNERHAKYTAVGQTIDRAFEIESCSIGGQVLISSSCLRSVKDQTKHKFLLDYIPNPNEFVKIKIYEVSGISGKYNIDCEKIIPRPAPLNKYIEASYSVLDGKRVSEKKIPCTLIAMSDEAAIIKTDSDTALLANIKLELSESRIVFAKIEDRTGDGLLAVFTSYII